MKLVAHSGEDHDTQATAAIQTIDIRAAEAAHSNPLQPPEGAHSFISWKNGISSVRNVREVSVADLTAYYLPVEVAGGRVIRDRVHGVGKLGIRAEANVLP